MDENTALVLALQLVALFSIAGALLLYLLCKIRGSGSDLSDGSTPGAGKPVLVTSADNAIGLQIAIHLATRGFRVFAGLKDGAASGSSEDSTSAKVIRAWQKHRESVQGQGVLIALPLDVTREDLLHEAVDIIRAHLPAGEDGMWAVINTNGLSYRGRLDQQDIAHWDAMLKTNVVGILRTARKFQSLLRNAGGRIVTVGATENLGAGLVAYVASRYAVEGASKALRQELSQVGVKVVTINPQGIMPELLFSAPKINSQQDQQETSVEITGCMDYQPVVLSKRALDILDIAITTRNPKPNYSLEEKLWCKPFEIFKIV
nr:D-beta-hydroxybutyrate dehydrogenase, mitochondrial [Leptinotarsa decemlineata]XP_023030117.1 D-beta-hydroxybutyrate dehydrogenase, mitochondrial [Leptinotarsa decemlineata]